MEKDVVLYLARPWTTLIIIAFHRIMNLSSHKYLFNLNGQFFWKAMFIEVHQTYDDNHPIIYKHNLRPFNYYIRLKLHIQTPLSIQLNISKNSWQMWSSLYPKILHTHEPVIEIDPWIQMIMNSSILFGSFLELFSLMQKSVEIKN